MKLGTPQMLVDDLVFPEGPRWHAGRLWLANIHAFEVVAIDPSGARESVLRLDDRPSGLGFLPDGRLLVVSMLERRLLRRDPSGVAVHADLSRFGPFCNDMVVDAQGRAYVGFMTYNPFAGESPPDGAAGGGIVLVTPDGEARLAAGDLAVPNGTVITPDGRTLMVGESRGSRLTAFDIAADGALHNRRVWATLDATPDGICLDAEGAIWVANPRAVDTAFLRVREGGEVTDRIAASEFRAIACMLGGADRKTLYLLEAISSHPSEIKGPGNGRVRAVQVEVPGAGWP
jgi:sugar lactone lactonase YvrE